MIENLQPILEQYGLVGVLAFVFAMSYWNTTKALTRTTEVADKALSSTATLKAEIETMSAQSKLRDDTLTVWLEKQMERINTQDSLTAKALEAITAGANKLAVGQGDLKTGQTTIIGTVETVSKHVLKMGEAVNKMADNPEIKAINDKLDQLIDEVRQLRDENKAHYQQTELRLEAVEAAVPPLQEKISAITTQEHPTVTVDDHSEKTQSAKPTKPAAKTDAPAASFSKTQARNGTEDTPPRETTDKPLTDNSE